MSAADAVLSRIVSAVDDEALGAYGVHVLVGEETAEHRWRSDDRENLYSVSKGVCAIAAGIAVDEGILSPDSTAGEMLPALATGDGAADVTLEDLLTMTSGIDFEWFGRESVPWPDLAGEMLRRPSRRRGNAFQYSDASTYVAMRMLGAVVGDVRDWLVPRLFDPLRIHNPQWHRCPAGWIVGGSGLYLRTEELSRIGRLLRDEGAWAGERLVSAEWIARMRDTRVETGGPAPFARYGLAVWDGPGRLARLDGLYGQYVLLDGGRDAVVTITGHEERRDGRLTEIALEALDA